jgi:hypothetical protein
MTFPLHVRARARALSTAEAYAERQIRSKLEKFDTHILRATVRFEDVNGPRGGVDTVCKVKVMLKRLGAVVLEERATGAREATNRAADGVERAVRRSIERVQKMQKNGAGKGAAASAKKTTTKKKASAGAAQRQKPAEPRRGRRRELPPPEDGSVIGRRVGGSRKQVETAAARPEKRRRDVPVDTAEKGWSATDRRAGGSSTAKRNTKLDNAGMISSLEDSAKKRPSRKSTRKSTNRVKGATQLTRRTQRAVRAPTTRARKSQARGTKARGS